MAYFQELPNISYPSLLPRSNKAEGRIEVKNIFKRAKLRDDVEQAITAFNYYQIEDGMRPDMVAERLYSDPELDWVVLTSNNKESEHVVKKLQNDFKDIKIVNFPDREILPYDHFSTPDLILKQRVNAINNFEDSQILVSSFKRPSIDRLVSTFAPLNSYPIFFNSFWDSVVLVFFRSLKFLNSLVPLIPPIIIHPH